MHDIWHKYHSWYFKIVRKELKNIIKLFELKLTPVTDVMTDPSHLYHGSAWSWVSSAFFPMYVANYCNKPRGHISLHWGLPVVNGCFNNNNLLYIYKILNGFATFMRTSNACPDSMWVACFWIKIAEKWWNLTYSIHSLNCCQQKEWLNPLYCLILGCSRLLQYCYFALQSGATTGLLMHQSWIEH